MDNNPFVIGAIAEDKNADEKYKILDIIENKITDYQGAIYKNQNTGELVAAHRGTEFNLGQGIQDAVIADGAMVIEAINAQVPDAMRLMERAKALAQMPENFVNGHPAPISTTGHSLGGTLAECMAYRYDVPGETFNAYGALGLHGVKEVASTQSVINHMRATDFVSAANGHYGEVRVYAKAEDIAALSMAGEVANRQGSAGFAYDIVKNVDAHAMGASFWPDSVISEANRKHYRDNTRLVDGSREDVRNSREVITFGSQFAQAVRLDPDAIKYIATQPLPKIPDHVERSVINAVLEPKERELTATGDLVSGFAKANAVVAEQSTLAKGRTLAAAVEFQGRVQSKAFDLAGDAAEKMEKTQGYVQQKITTQASRVAADAVEVSGAVAAERRSAKGRLDAFGERVKGEAQGAMLSFVGSAYRVGGWFSDDLKQEAKVFDQAASQIRQQAMDKSQAALQRAAVDAKDIRQDANQLAKGIEQRAETLGQTQRQLHDRHAVMMNSTLDLAGQQGQKVSAQIAADIRNKSTDIGESQGHGIRNTGANIDRGLDSAAENLKRVRTNALDAVTNPRSAEGKAAHLNGPSIADMGHPHHSLYVQAHSKLDGMWMTTGFRSRQELDNTAGALAAAAAKDGLDRIDHVLISKDGKRFFAVEGGATDPAHHRADVDMQQAQQQTLDQSTKQANQALQSAGPQEPPPSHGMRR